MIETHRYASKPREVHAVQVTVENMQAIANWVGGSIVTESSGNRYISVAVHNPHTERQSQAHVTDWVLYSELGPKPSFKVYLDRAFENNFDQVSTETVMHGTVHKNYQTQNEVMADPEPTAPVPVAVAVAEPVVNEVVVSPADVVLGTGKSTDEILQEQADFAKSQAQT